MSASAAAVVSCRHYIAFPRPPSEGKPHPFLGSNLPPGSNPNHGCCPWLSLCPASSGGDMTSGWQGLNRNRTPDRGLTSFCLLGFPFCFQSGSPPSGASFFCVLSSQVFCAPLLGRISLSLLRFDFIAVPFDVAPPACPAYLRLPRFLFR